MVEFKEVVVDYADVMTLAEWIASVKVGAFIPDDGFGCWGTSTHYNSEYDCFQQPPKGATHVHWYNK